MMDDPILTALVLIHLPVLAWAGLIIWRFPRVGFEQVLSRVIGVLVGLVLPLAVLWLLWWQ